MDGLKRSNCPAYLHAHWNYRDELTVADGLILKGTRIVIPESLQPDVLKKLHYAHQGAEKCKLRAKGSVFWAKINHDIEELVKSCPPPPPMPASTEFQRQATFAAS